MHKQLHSVCQSGYWSGKVRFFLLFIRCLFDAAHCKFKRCIRLLFINDLFIFSTLPRVTHLYICLFLWVERKEHRPAWLTKISNKIVSSAVICRKPDTELKVARKTPEASAIGLANSSRGSERGCPHHVASLARH